MNDEESTLMKVLHKIATEQNFKNYKIDVTSVSTDGANYSSALFTAIISENKKQNLNLFAKKLILGEQIREEVGEIGEDNEIHFYKNILPVFKRLEANNEIPIEHRLHIPKFYDNDPTSMNETIVMENMSASGYTSFNRFTTADWNYATVAVRELAKWHALSIAFRNSDPEEFNKVTENREFPLTLATKMNKMIDNAVETTINMIKEDNRDKVWKLFSKYRENEINYYDIFYKPMKCPVMIHGDYRPSNLVHKVNGDGSYSITILDFQTFRSGNPASDLVYFLVAATDELFRKKNYDRLIDFYYTELGLSLKRLNIDIANVYPRDDFDFELKETLPFGLIWAMFLLPIITVNPEDAPVLNKIEDMSIPVNPLCIERINGLVNDFVNWNIL